MIKKIEIKTRMQRKEIEIKVKKREKITNATIEKLKKNENKGLKLKQTWTTEKNQKKI